MSYLLVLMNGVEAGRLDYERGRISLTYEGAWRERRGAIPISLSMPMTAAAHTGAKVGAFIWGLLPDNEQIIQEWARRFHVSARQPFGLIGAVGEDCAGAVQFVVPDRVGAVLSGELDGVEWLSTAQIAERLAGLRTNRGAWPSADLEAQVENEHFCLSVLGRLGLPVAQSHVQSFDGEIAIVVERYDRLVTETGVVRIHQEDFCQALGVMPDRKYQNEGGPGLRDIISLIREVSESPQEDVQTLIDATIFNWIVGGSDAHAKNFSLLLSAGGRARLAPIYDVARVLPYAPQVQFQDVKLAMKIGGEYRLSEINMRHWSRFAEENRIDVDQVRERISLIADQLPDVSSDVRDQIARDGAGHAINDKLAAICSDRAKWVKDQMARAALP